MLEIYLHCYFITLYYLFLFSHCKKKNKFVQFYSICVQCKHKRKSYCICVNDSFTRFFCTAFQSTFAILQHNYKMTFFVFFSLKIRKMYLQLKNFFFTKIVLCKFRDNPFLGFLF